jgi:YbbR domain-containing protein
MYRRPVPRSGLAGTIDMALDVQRRVWVATRATPGLALLSLVLGFAVWLAVTDVENPTRVARFPAAIPVEAANVDRTLAVANTLQRVEVTLSAPDDRWQRLTSENLRAFVDLSGLDGREQLVPVQVDVRGIAGVRVASVTPPSLLVNLEPLTTKRVPVTPVLRGSVPLGYEVTQSTPSQPDVFVTGPTSLVGLVQDAAAEVTVTGLTVELVETAQLVARGEGGAPVRGVRLEPETARVRVQIVQSTLRRQVPLQPTYSGEPAAGYRVASVVALPSAVTMDGAIDALQGLDSLVLPAVDVSGARDSVVRTVRIAPPRGVASPEMVEATVTVDIQPVQGTVRVAVPVVLQGGPPSARLSGETAVVVTVAGSLPVLNALAASELQAVATLTANAPGTYQVQVRVTSPANTRVVSVQPETVSVTIGGP